MYKTHTIINILYTLNFKKINVKHLKREQKLNLNLCRYKCLHFFLLLKLRL